MKYYCKICGQGFKTKSGPNSEGHLNSKMHSTALKEKTSSNSLSELLLFTIIQKTNKVTYSKILQIFSSFGIKSEVSLQIIIKKLKENDLVYNGQFDSEYAKVLEIIINFPKIDYPLSYTVQEVVDKFKVLKVGYPKDYIDFFSNLSKKYPEFVSLSSSKIGAPPDIITFKQLFIENIIFQPQNNWNLL